MRKFLMWSFIAVSLSACQATMPPYQSYYMGNSYNTGSGGYYTGSPSSAEQTFRGVIVNTRMVNVSAPQSGIGIGAGAATGAIVGSTLGHGSSGHAAGAVGGAVLGGIAGGLIENGVNRQTALEYTVQADSGAFITVVQGREPQFGVGQRVLVVYGPQPRIVPDQGYYEHQDSQDPYRYPQQSPGAQSYESNSGYQDYHDYQGNQGDIPDYERDQRYTGNQQPQAGSRIQEYPLSEPPHGYSRYREEPEDTGDQQGYDSYDDDREEDGSAY